MELENCGRCGLVAELAAMRRKLFTANPELGFSFTNTEIAATGKEPTDAE